MKSRTRATIFRRLCRFLPALAACVAVIPAMRGAAVEATVAPQSLCDALLASMKGGTTLDFAARRDLLAPVIRRNFNLGLMTRLIVGAAWRDMEPGDQGRLEAAFADYTISVYADRFKSYGGERFEVDPNPTTLPRGDRIVRTKLFTGAGKVVRLDYLVREFDGNWQIIDIYLNGTISELATRRSEYSTVLRQGGAPVLIELLEQKTAGVGEQRPASE